MAATSMFHKYRLSHLLLFTATAMYDMLIVVRSNWPHMGLLVGGYLSSQASYIDCKLAIA